MLMSSQKHVIFDDMEFWGIKGVAQLSIKQGGMKSQVQISTRYLFPSIQTLTENYFLSQSVVGISWKQSKYEQGYKRLWILAVMVISIYYINSRVAHKRNSEHQRKQSRQQKISNLLLKKQLVNWINMKGSQIQPTSLRSILSSKTINCNVRGIRMMNLGS